MKIINRAFKIYLREKYMAARLYNAEENIAHRVITNQKVIEFCYMLTLLFGIITLLAIMTANSKLIIFSLALLLPPVSIIVYSDYDKWRRRLLKKNEDSP